VVTLTNSTVEVRRIRLQQVLRINFKGKFHVRIICVYQYGSEEVVEK